MTQLGLEIETTLRRVGAKGTQKGFWGVCVGVELALDDPTLLHGVTKRLYPAIASACGMSTQSMVRDMRSLVTWCWEYGDLELVAERKLVEKPTVGEFIDHLAAYHRRKTFYR